MHHGRGLRGGDSPTTTPSDHRPSIPDADSAELGRVEPTGPNNAQRINKRPRAALKGLPHPQGGGTRCHSSREALSVPAIANVLGLLPRTVARSDLFAGADYSSGRRPSSERWVAETLKVGEVPTVGQHSSTLTIAGQAQLEFSDRL
jgi:hypothetical protein